MLRWCSLAVHCPHTRSQRLAAEGFDFGLCVWEVFLVSFVLFGRLVGGWVVGGLVGSLVCFWFS